MNGKERGGIKVADPYYMNFNKKNIRNQKKEIVQPELGPRNWMAGKSLDDTGAIGFPGEQLSAYLQRFTHNSSKDKDKYDKNLFFKG